MGMKNDKNFQNLGEKFIFFIDNKGDEKLSKSELTVIEEQQDFYFIEMD